MTGPDLTPESVKRRFDDETINKAKTFRTLGVGRQAALNYLDTPQGTKYLEQLLDASPNLTNDELQSRAIGQIASGRELPRIEINSDPLFKIVPKGSQPSQHSPFWAKETDLNAAVNGGKNLSDHFALPVASESPRYDVYRIIPKAPAEAFVNTVAPTSELDGLVKKTGGARQYLTPDRNLYQPAELMRSVDNRLHVPLKGTTAVRPTIKAAGVLGTAYGAYDAKNQIDAAIDTARSTREQWVRGAEESANQATKTVVTGGAAVVGAVPGAAAGALTSPVTGPVGPVAGGLATGGAAAYGAEKLYEESRLQQFSKYLGRQMGDLGYNYLSREGRLLRQVNGLQEELSEAKDPTERARLQGRLDQVGAAFLQEAERNSRDFDDRAMAPSMSLSPAQQRYHQQATEQLGPGLQRAGFNEEQIHRVMAAAVSHAQSHARSGPVQAFHLSKDAQRVAMIEPNGSLSEFRLNEAMTQSAERHLAQANAHASAHVQHQSVPAPQSHEPPVMAR